MITRIELKNFMSHEHTVIEPACGLTVIAGPNNCGKSAIVTALQILCYNDESTFVMRHGAKECSIKVFTDDGHEIEWNRTKNKSTKYIIDGQQHDRLGRGGTPDELHEILRIQKVDCDNQEFDVHFGAQQSPVFLLNDPPRAAAQFFASSSDAINLIGMQTRHKQKVRERKQEQRRLSTELDEVNLKLERLESVPDLTRRLIELESNFQKLRSQEEEIAALNNLVNAIAEKSTHLKLLNAQVESLRILDAPPELAPTELFEESLTRIRRNGNQLAEATAVCKVLEDLAEVPDFQETKPLDKLINTLRFVERDFLVAEKRSDVLACLEAPPQEKDTGLLENLLDELAQVQFGWTRAEKQWQACEDVLEPPTQVPPDQLEQLLRDMNGQAKELGDLDSELQQLEKQWKQLRSEMSAWVEENPSCPTCGTQLDAEQILGGGHRHG